MLSSDRRLKILLLLLVVVACNNAGAFADDSAEEKNTTKYQSRDDTGGGDELQKIDIRSGRKDDYKARDDLDAIGGQSSHKDDKSDDSDDDSNIDKDYSTPKPGDGYLFGGSEFKLSDYVDTDFSKHLFRDLFVAGKKWDPLSDLSKPLTADDDTMRGDDVDSYFTFVDDRRRRDIEDRRERLLRDLMEPHYGVPGDWVPSNLDPTNNGGFTTAPDNGSPVPYRLNGWIDFQRKRPWKKDDGD